MTQSASRDAKDLRVASEYYLKIEPPSGEVVSLPLIGPGGQIRVGVGKPGHRGAVWKIAASKVKPDVYLTNRQLGRVHISLHESGRWHSKFKSGPNVPEDYLDRWERPLPNAAGWTQAVSIWTMAEDVIDVPGDNQTSGRIQWVSAPPPGSVTGLHAFLAHPGPDPVTLDAVPIAGMMLVNGESLLIVHSEHPLSEEELERRIQRREILDQIPGDANTRVTMHAYGNDGPRHIYELAVHPSTSAWRSQDW